jgi:hypothetical protein
MAATAEHLARRNLMSELDELKERIRILEQRSRRLRNVGIGLAVFVIAGFACAKQRQETASRTAIPDAIEAKKFVLKDDNGAVRGVLEFGVGGTTLNLYEPEGSPAQAFPAGYLDSNGLVLYKNVPVVQGKARPFAWTNSEYFKLFDENGTERAVLGSTALENTKTGAVTSQPASSLTLFDKEGKVLWRAP